MIQKTNIVKCLFSIVLFISCISIQAEELVVFLKKVEQVTFAIDKKPVVTFENDSLIIISESNEFVVPIEDVESYKILNFTTSQDKIKEVISVPIIEEGHVYYKQLPAGSQIRIYDITGKKLRVYTADKIGNVDIDLSSLPKGIFVISSSISNIKVSIR